MIPRREAVRRLLNSERYDGKRTRAAALSWLRRLEAQVDDATLAGVDDAGCWFIHPSVHPALTEPAVESRRAGKVLDVPERVRNQATAKVQLVLDFAAYRSGPGRAMREADARRAFTDLRGGVYGFRVGGERVERRFSVSSLRRWADLYRDGGVDGLAADEWGGARGGECSPEAVEMYLSWRNHANRYSIRQCFQVVAAEAKTKRWRWHATYAACQAWDRRTRNTRALTLNQRGDEAYTRRCGRYIELDPESYAPGECYVGDDHTFNVWVRFPNGKIVRPVGSFWQDWRSRKIVGFRVVPSGTEDSLSLAFRDAAQAVGVPSVVIADNGKNFTSWQWTGGAPRRHVYRHAGELEAQYGGIFALCGIAPSWCLPYNPNGKARLERFFGTMDDQFVRLFPAYTGKNPSDRPDAHAALIARAVDLAEFVAQLKRWVPIYNAAPHSGEGMDGRTPDQVMALATHKRAIDENLLPLLLSSWRRPVKIGRNGVTLRAFGTAIRYGAAEPALQALNVGTQVRIAYDPEDLSSVTVWSMDFKFICRAACNARMNRSLASEELRETMRAIASEKRTLRRAQRIGFDHLRDPVDRALAAQSRASAARRKPDGDHPDGGPLLVPVITPLEPVPASRLHRKAAGAEGLDLLARLEKFANAPAPRTVKPTGLDALYRLGESEGKRP